MCERKEEGGYNEKREGRKEGGIAQIYRRQYTVGLKVWITVTYLNVPNRTSVL